MSFEFQTVNRCESIPDGIEIAGIWVRFAVMVKISARYIDSGSAFSPEL
jgi:hypothetical protein